MEVATAHSSGQRESQPTILIDLIKSIKCYFYRRVAPGGQGKNLIYPTINLI